MPQPDPTSASRAEYLERIHRVMDYVENHLERPLTLEELARVACFSPYHFHRLFSALAGESLHQFILRLRLEKAASQLLYNPKKSITEVALDCGFGGSATFARAFRAGFGTSASQWRAGGSKNCKTNGKPCKAAPEGGSYLASIAAAQPGAGDTDARSQAMPAKNTNLPTKPAQSTRFETIEPMTVAYVRHIGPYAGDAALFGRLFGKLFGWAGPRGLLGPDTRPLTIYHDNPEVTDEERLRISVCVQVPPQTRPDGEIGVMVIPAGKYVVAGFELSVDEYGAAWNWLMGTWFPSSGYQPDDRPCFELSLNDPDQHPQKKHVVELWEPVRPL